MDPKELIAALATLVDASASDEAKAAALDKLSAYFNSLLDAQQAQEKETQASESSESSEEKSNTSEGEPTTSSESGGSEEEKEPSKELASALATIKSLTERVAKLEKASSIGLAKRASRPTVIPRVDPPAPKDATIMAIEAAARNTLRNLSK